MKRFEIKKGMTLQSLKTSSYQIEIIRRKDMRWQVRKLTDRTNIYNGTHTMSDITIWKNFQPI